MNIKQIIILITTVFLSLYGISTIMFHDDFHDGWKAYESKYYKTAFKLWLPLADQENDRAQFYLGIMYKKGQGVPQDYDEAFKWYRLALEQGHKSAKDEIYDLGYRGFPAAFIILKNDAKQGNYEAQFSLARTYHLGKGVPHDYNEAFKWYQLVLEQGRVSVKIFIYRLANNSIPAAFKLLTDNAKKGEAEAQLHLGSMYKKGQGVPQDFKKAILWYQAAVENDLDLAQVEMGKIYEEGQIVPQDYIKAFKLYRLAAEHRNSTGQLNLGIMYFKGQGVPQDFMLANKWFIISSLQENQEAKKYISMVESKMSPQQKEKALEMAKKECLIYSFPTQCQSLIVRQ